MRSVVPAVLCLVTATMSAAVAAPARNDLRDYALASCLTRQTASRDLQAKGYRLADVVLTRAGASPLDWKPLDAAVGAAFARQGMVMVHADGPVAQATRPTPLASCLLAIESPAVQAAMRGLAVPRKR